MARAESLMLDGAWPSAQLMVGSAVASLLATCVPFIERHDVLAKIGARWRVRAA
jgi:hypothetical protein